MKIKTKRKIRKIKKIEKPFKVYRSSYYYINKQNKYKILWIHKYKRKDNKKKKYSKKNPGYCPWATLPKYPYCIHYRKSKDSLIDYTGNRYRKNKGVYILDTIRRGYDD